MTLEKKFISKFYFFAIFIFVINCISFLFFNENQVIVGIISILNIAFSFLVIIRVAKFMR